MVTIDGKNEVDNSMALIICTDVTFQMHSERTELDLQMLRKLPEDAVRPGVTHAFRIMYYIEVKNVNVHKKISFDQKRQWKKYSTVAVIITGASKEVKTYYRVILKESKVDYRVHVPQADYVNDACIGCPQRQIPFTINLQSIGSLFVARRNVSELIEC